MTTKLKTNLRDVVEDAIDTEGTTIEDITDVEAEDRPAYTVAHAIAWARRPENAPRIEQVARQAGKAQRQFVHQLDDQITQVKDVLVRLAVDDEEREGFFDGLLRQFTGIED